MPNITLVYEALASVSASSADIFEEKECERSTFW
jgi:hypothetical protein